jgi:hypothetical protein
MTALIAIVVLGGLGAAGLVALGIAGSRRG